MNAEALIGKVLGTCTLQRLVGQGGMGAVFLAQQSRPHRQVAVKVLLPITPLNNRQLAAFLERFRRETDAAASLEHPNIMPVHEYGEQDGIVYLVMPYVSGGTLRDELERSGPLSLQKTVDYLEQLAAAIDFAHEHGVIHRDIKPANMMITTEGRLLLADFGLVKIVADGQKPQVRLTGAGAPVGTPDYMAPEQVIGEEVDTRADLYSLGVILFQMLTGTTPFQGETPMQIAAQHLQIPPPSPQMLRPDLPIAAEQVVLRAMAKRPADRYTKAKEMATAFRLALLNAGIKLDPEHTWAGLLSGSTASRLPVPKGQFEPFRQTASMPKVVQPGTAGNFAAAQQQHEYGQFSGTRPHGGGLLSRSSMFIDAAHKGMPGKSIPAQNNNAPQITPAAGGGGLLSRNGVFPQAGKASATAPAATATGQGHGLLSRTGKFPMFGASPTAVQQPGAYPAQAGQLFAANQTSMTGAPNTGNIGMLANSTHAPSPLSSAWATGIDTSAQSKTEGTAYPNMGNNALAPYTATSTTGTLQSGGTGTIKLNEPVKVVKVPVGDQPGQYITGILPFEKQPDEIGPVKPARKLKPWMASTLAVLAVIVVLGMLAAFALLRNNANQTYTPPSPGTTGPQSLAAATADANVLLSDPLNRNIHNWPDGPNSKFKNGAYHVIDSGDKGKAVLIAGQNYSNLAYTITMQEIKGDDTSTKNIFGMIFRFNQQTEKGQQVTRFYSFEVVNTNGGEYQFWLYDSSKTNQWTEIKNGHLPFGKEYHQGKAANTIEVTMKGSTFTVFVNKTQLKQTFTDSTIKNGTVGMIVNNDGTEVAFKNLLLTKN
jgi:Serine/threonine protein kinase